MPSAARSMLDAIKTGGRDGLSARAVRRDLPAAGGGSSCGSPGRSGSTPRSAPSFWPLLGIIFLPFATLIYLLLYTPGRGLSGWDWFWVVLAALLDIGHWGVSATQRNQIPGRRASEA